MLADYSFYLEIYGGTLVPEASFERIFRRGETFLLSLVKNPESLSSLGDKVQQLLCCLCDELYRQEKRGGFVRESLDGYDVTYDKEGENRALVSLVRQHLGREGVLYRGREA